MSLLYYYDLSCCDLNGYNVCLSFLIIFIFYMFENLLEIWGNSKIKFVILVFDFFDGGFLGCGMKIW